MCPTIVMMIQLAFQKHVYYTDFGNKWTEITRRYPYTTGPSRTDAVLERHRELNNLCRIIKWNSEQKLESELPWAYKHFRDPKTCERTSLSREASVELAFQCSWQPAAAQEAKDKMILMQRTNCSMCLVLGCTVKPTAELSTSVTSTRERIYEPPQRTRIPEDWWLDV